MGRELDGIGIEEYRELLEEELDDAHDLVETGSSIRRNKRLVVVITPLTLQRIALLSHRFLREGPSEYSSKSGLANYLICRALPEVEEEMLSNGDDPQEDK